MTHNPSIVNRVLSICSQALGTICGQMLPLSASVVLMQKQLCRLLQKLGLAQHGAPTQGVLIFSDDVVPVWLWT